MVSAGNINSFTKGLDKSVDDSSIHGLAGEGGCLGPVGLWGRPRGEDPASLRASLGPGRRRALGRRDPRRQCSVPAGGSSARHGPFSQYPQHSPFIVWGDNNTTTTGGVLARLSPKGPAEGDRHRVQSPLPEQRQASQPRGGQASALGPSWVPTAVLGPEERGAEMDLLQ